MRAALRVAIIALVAAYGTSPARATTVALPTMTSDAGGCRGIGLEATLIGDPADPRVAWLDDDRGGRHELIWPPGYTARFTPELRVIDTSGTVVFRGGERIDGGCTAGSVDDPGEVLVMRPFP
jgi:hypothetical protein